MSKVKISAGKPSQWLVMHFNNRACIQPRLATALQALQAPGCSMLITRGCNCMLKHDPALNCDPKFPERSNLSEFQRD